jgi:phosphoenolpyruvate-protein kinase (PTS system EI component)
VVAREVTADDLLVVAREVAGAVSVDGGAAGHAAIVARALGVPLVLGVDLSLLESADGTEVLVDGAAGLAVTAPDQAERAGATRELAAARQRRARLAAARGLAPVTLDGHRVGLLANVAALVDAEASVAAAAEGVGLLRTELRSCARCGGRRWLSTWPRSTGARSARRTAGTVRTLDFADDKLPPFLQAGVTGRVGRGLPLMLAAGEAFAEQFRAILTAGAGMSIKSHDSDGGHRGGAARLPGAARGGGRGHRASTRRHSA